MNKLFLQEIKEIRLYLVLRNCDADLDVKLYCKIKFVKDFPFV